jgi:tRNA pseudouridine65 synthase
MTNSNSSDGISSELKILFQNRDFVALDKPPGLSVHNVEEAENLLVLAQRQIQIAKLYPVHRLDKETSGVQILALHEAAARNLATEFQKKEAIQKIYLGVLRGALRSNSGIWNQPLSDKSEGRRNPAGLAKDRVPCETRYKVLRQSNFFTMCEFDLITGRQHQIRKHTALVRQPLVGDPRYGEPKYNQRIAEIYGEPRMFLHCARLAIAGEVLVSATPECFVRLFEGASSS